MTTRTKMLARQWMKGLGLFIPGFLVRAVEVLVGLLVGFIVGLLILSLFLTSTSQSSGTPFFAQAVTFRDVYIWLGTWLVVTLWELFHAITRFKFHVGWFYLKMSYHGRIVTEEWQPSEGGRVLNLKGFEAEEDGRLISTQASSPKTKSTK